MAGRIPRDETRILCIAAGLVRSADKTSIADNLLVATVLRGRRSDISE